MSIHEWIQQGSVSEEIAEKRGLKELVRCKDCAYLDYCELSYSPDWFCADGKKKGKKKKEVKNER